MHSLVSDDFFFKVNLKTLKVPGLGSKQRFFVTKYPLLPSLGLIKRD